MNIRIANLDDAPRIFEILDEVAPEIPLLLDTEARQARVKEIVHERIESQSSLVAINGSDLVLGFILVELKTIGIVSRDHLYLAYICVSKSCRNQGISTHLIEKMKERKLPLTAIVKRCNTSVMIDRFMNAGFEVKYENIAEQGFVWYPECIRNNDLI